MIKLLSTVCRMDALHFVIEWILQHQRIIHTAQIDAVIQIIVSIVCQAKMNMDVCIRVYRSPFKHQWCGTMDIALITVYPAMQLLVEHIQGKWKKLHWIKANCNTKRKETKFFTFKIQTFNGHSITNLTQFIMCVFTIKLFKLFIFHFFRLGAIYNGSIIKLLRMVCNSIHLGVEVFRRVWHPFIPARNVIVVVIIGVQVVSGIQTVPYRLSNRLQHQFNHNHANHAHSVP